MVVAAAEIEASLLARQLGRWGAKTCAAIDENIAAALLPERPWDALLVDYPLASAMIASVNVARLGVPKRIVLIRPTDRHELPALKAAGFTGYLVKPVRAASLAARLTVEDAFEHSPAETEVETAETSAHCRQKGTLDPGRGGQRDQCVSCARTSHASWSPPNHRDQRRSRGRILAGGARFRQSLRSCADGCANAGH